MRSKAYRAAIVIAIFLGLLFSVQTFARDSYSTITGVKLRLSDSFKELEAGDPWPSLSEGDFEVGDSEKYFVDSVQWYDNNMRTEMRVGDTAKVRVYLEARTKRKSGGDEVVYRFSGSYGSSNVRIVNGSLLSVKRNGYYDMELLLTLPAVKGDYDMAENPSWSAGSLGYAAWDAPSNGSGYYEVSLYRDTRRLVTITTDARALNLYPWMTEEGDYRFTVVTIPYTEEQKKYGKKSDTAESDYQTIRSDNRSNGDGKYGTTQISGNTSGNAGSGTSVPNGTGTVGWFQSSGGWYFRYPNQQLLRDSWLSWKDRWYHFNSQGQMETGWYKSSYGNWFYLDPGIGYAKTGWQQINNVWYYFNTAKGDSEAVMFQNTFGRIGNDYYYFDQNGAMRTGWVSVKDSSGVEQYYYFYEDGRMARNTEVSGFRLDGNGRWIH